MKNEIIARDKECPKYKIGDKVCIIDRRNTNNVLTIVRVAEWSNNHFMLMEVKGLTEITHPFSWRQFRKATDIEAECGKRLHNLKN